MSSPLPSIACVGALYTGSERGLAADVLASRTLGLAPHTVCTAIVAASHGRVTDLTEVPSDTVSSQLEHLAQTVPVDGVRIGVLGSVSNAEVVLRWAQDVSGPVVLEIVASGPNGETVLPARGVDVLADHLGLADLVIVSRQDAELVTRAEIGSLDDAQVAAQRIVNRGAKRVLIHCGVLPTRFFDPAHDPGQDDEAGTFAADVMFDGEDFALFEVPVDSELEGGDSIYAITVLDGVLRGTPLLSALQDATLQAVESTRWSAEAADGRNRISYDWRHQRAAINP